MTDDIPTIESPDWQLVDPPGQAPVGKTIHRMVDVLTGGKPPERQKVDVSAAFDRGMKGVDLVLEDTKPIWPKNPVSSGTRRKTYKPPATVRTRPPGAEDLQGLFATGIILLLVFTVGDWATPTAEEATAIAAPLANILARRIDLAARLGKDASDTIALAVAILSYLARVGPIAAERVRTNLDNRRRRERVVPAYRPADSGVEGGMDAGTYDRASTASGPPANPFDAIAKARGNGLGFLDREFGYTEGRDSSVGDVR
jgi:hypothetical protein